MRVIAGIRRGMKLIDFDGEQIRPTSDRVKEAIFSIIMPYINDAYLLDLFAGSGALIIEAISRGAKGGVCVDKNADSVKILQKNLDNTRFNDFVEVCTKDAKDYIASCKESFDIIFLDPPYSKGIENEIISFIQKSNILALDGIVVLETEQIDHLQDFDLDKIKQKRYGRTHITIYKRSRQ